MANKAGKGSAFERWLCRELSLWFSGGAADDWYWRSSNSGGRSTVRGKKGLRTAGHCGDITVAHPEGQPLLDLISWELKRGYNRVTAADLLDAPDGATKQEFGKWLAQAAAAAGRAGSFSWALVHKRDRREALVWLPGHLMSKLLWAGSGFPHGTRNIGFLPPGFRLADGRPDLYLYGFRLADFFLWCEPGHVRKAARRLKRKGA